MSLPTASLHTGDALTVLRGMPDSCVQCVVTSPPYWGLRDYGTGTWEGGDPACTHKQGRNGAGRADGIVDERGQRNRDGAGAYSTVCRCGARRVDDQIGLEATPEEHVARLVEVFREVRRVLRSDGLLFVNYGDAYCADTKWGGASGGKNEHSGAERRRTLTGLKPKDLIGLPWRLAFALQADGWWLRCDVIWAKPNPMPESVTDRPTRSHEYVFLFAKSERYYYDAEAVREANQDVNGTERYLSGRCGLSRSDYEPKTQGWNGTGMTSHYRDYSRGRNRRSVWTIATEPYPEAHFATFPRDLVRPCILAGTSEYGACPTCGAPWRRVVEASYTVAGVNKHRTHPREASSYIARGTGQVLNRRNATTGWAPTCACPPADPVPCVVLDPFAGSATVGVVALEYGRAFLGVELNPAYVAMAERRLANVRHQAPLPLHAHAAPAPAAPAQGELAGLEADR